MKVVTGLVYPHFYRFSGANCRTLHLLQLVACNILGIKGGADDGETCLTTVADTYMSQCTDDFPPLTQRTVLYNTPSRIGFWAPRMSRSLATEPNAQSGLVVITSGWDGHQVIGQLGLCFALEEYVVEELAVAFAQFLHELTDPSFGDGSTHICISRSSLHFATSLVWDGHQGYTRCIPKCQAADVKHTFYEATDQPLAFACIK